MKRLNPIFWAVIFSGLLGLTALAETANPVTDAGNQTCPVSGKAVNPKVTAVYKGKRYAFCCKDCLKDFQKNPEKYIAGHHHHHDHDHEH